MGGESFDYKFGNKNNWRRWAWNRMAENVSNRSSDVVLYLAGRDDLDRPVAMQKGFKGHNLIAVEREASALDSLRKKRVLAIHGEMLDVLESWSSSVIVGGAMIDMCSGLSNDMAWRIRWLITDCRFKDTSFCLNFLRGRDASSNELRSIMKTKNRAMAMFALVGFSILRELGENRSAEMFKIVYEEFSPSFRTYKSSSCQVFDSVAFRNPIGRLLRKYDHGEIARLQGVRPDRTGQTMRTAAILAHRTMRMQAV